MGTNITSILIGLGVGFVAYKIYEKQQKKKSGFSAASGCGCGE